MATTPPIEAGTLDDPQASITPAVLAESVVRMSAYHVAISDHLDGRDERATEALTLAAKATRLVSEAVPAI